MIKKLLNKIKTFPEWPIVQHVLHWSKRVTIPGFAKVPLYNVIYFIIKESQRDAITTRANSIAFNFFLAIFPAIIFVFTMIPYLPFSEYMNEVIPNAINEALPANAAGYLIGIIEDISIKREGLLSFGFLLSAFFASNGMLTLMFGFDKSYDKTFKRRSYLKHRLLAVLLTILMVLMFVISIVFIIIGEQLIGWILEILHIQDGHLLFSMLRWLITLLVIYFGITTIYRYGPSMYRRIPFLNLGALLATILSILASLGFSFFITNFGRYNEIYGSIGALIVILLWLQINAFVILIGFELNASIAVNRDLLSESED